MSAQRQNQSTTAYSWAEIMERLGALAGNIMAKRYVAFVTAARPQDNIPAHLLANLLNADYYAQSIGSTPTNASSLVFAIDNHGIATTTQPVIAANNYVRGDANVVSGYACLWRFNYQDPTYNTLMVPEFYLEDFDVEVDARPKKIAYPWEL